MSFNAVSSLLAVSSAHDTVHVFKLGATGSAGAGSGGGGGGGVQSPAPSEDGSVDGGYEAFIDKKRGSSMGYVYYSFSVIGMSKLIRGGLSRSSLQRRVNNYSKALTTSVGGYLPKPFTEMWEPSRDFAFLRLPSGGARSIVGLSGYVAVPSHLVFRFYGALRAAFLVYACCHALLVLRSTRHFRVDFHSHVLALFCSATIRPFPLVDND